VNNAFTVKHFLVLQIVELITYVAQGSRIKPRKAGSMFREQGK